MDKLQQQMDVLQFQLYAEQKRSLLIVLQGPDAGGKVGVIRHVLASMNPQGSHVVGFKSMKSAKDIMRRSLRTMTRKRKTTN